VSDLPPCDQEVFNKGHTIAILDIPKEVAEDMCKKCVEVTGFKTDWHYAMGRVIIKTLAPADHQQTFHFWNVVRINLNPGGIMA
jgi:hypothetical protein